MKLTGLCGAILLALPLLFGCDAAGEWSRSAAAGAANSSPPPERLAGRVLTDTLSLAFPRDLLAHDDRIAVLDSRGEFALQVFDSKGNRLAVAGREGAGPGEFVSPRSIFERPGHPGAVWLYDSRLNRLTAYDLSELDSAEIRPTGILQLETELVMESPRWLDSTSLVALNTMFQPAEGRFMIFASNGAPQTSMGEPPPGADGVPAFIRQQAYGGEIAVHPDGSRFILASNNAGRLELFTAEGSRSVFATPDPFDPDYRPAPDGINMFRGPKFRFGYIDVDAASERVYALFSGKRFHDHPQTAYTGNQVHVFDWDGSLLRVLMLDADLFAITVDDEERQLYGTRLDPYPQLMSYPLRAPNVESREGR